MTPLDAIAQAQELLAVAAATIVMQPAAPARWVSDTCPFCQSSNIDTKMDRGDDWHVACNTCGARGPLEANPQKAFMAWRRVAPC